MAGPSPHGATRGWLAGAYEDWEEESTVLGSELKISDAARLQLQKTGLLRRNPSREGEEAVVDVGLQNLDRCV